MISIFIILEMALIPFQTARELTKSNLVKVLLLKTYLLKIQGII